MMLQRSRVIVVIIFNLQELFIGVNTNNVYGFQCPIV
jgi:hypothetical protein